jgi:hypothetical protein
MRYGLNVHISYHPSNLNKEYTAMDNLNVPTLHTLLSKIYELKATKNENTSFNYSLAEFSVIYQTLNLAEMAKVYVENNENASEEGYLEENLIDCANSLVLIIEGSFKSINAHGYQGINVNGNSQNAYSEKSTNFMRYLDEYVSLLDQTMIDSVKFYYAKRQFVIA